MRSEMVRALSTTRPNRVEVERMKVPEADISKAGVIIAASTASAAFSD